MAIIVFDRDARSDTAQAFKYEVDALTYKNALESENRLVEYLDLPSVDYRDAQQIVIAMR